MAYGAQIECEITIVIPSSSMTSLSWRTISGTKIRFSPITRGLKTHCSRALSVCSAAKRTYSDQQCRQDLSKHIP